MPVSILYTEGTIAKVLTLDIYEEETLSLTSQVSKHPVEGGDVVTDQVQLDNPRLVVSGYVSNKPLPSNYLNVGGYATVDNAAGDYGKVTLEKTTKQYKLEQHKPDLPAKPFRANAGALLDAGISKLVGNAPEFQKRVEDTTKTSEVSVTAWQLQNPEVNRVKEAFDQLQTLWRSKQRVHVVTDITELLDCIVSEVSMPRTTEDGEGSTFSVTFEQIKTAVAAETKAAAPSEPLVQPKKAAGSKATDGAEKKKEALRSELERMFFYTPPEGT